MKKQSQSTLGYIMSVLNVQTTAMAKILHVDPSLISKWKSGARPLTKQSIYFNDVVQCLMQHINEDNYQAIQTALSHFFPHTTFSTMEQIEKHIACVLSGEVTESMLNQSQTIFENVKTVPTLFFNDTQGRQDAVTKLFDYADAMVESGELTFIDTDSFRWIWDNHNFSKIFTERLLKLLKRGFHVTFAIRYSSSKESFHEFFDSFSPIIFHKNVDWYYVQYYDAPIIGITQIIVNHAISTIGMFSTNTNMTTMVFMDSAIVLQHENFANNFIAKCIPLFHEFIPSDMSNVLVKMPEFRRNKSFFSFLPVPAFMAVDTNLLKDILHTNGVEPTSEEYLHVMETNRMFKGISGIYSEERLSNRDDTVLIFQIEKMLERVKSGSFVSSSLTHLCKKNIIIQPLQHARELRSLVSILKSHENIHIVLASEKDSGSLPHMNCWCMLDNYVLQMNSKGFRFCEESTVVSIASNALVRCMHKVPPARRDNKSVVHFLEDMAQELEEKYQYLEDYSI